MGNFSNIELNAVAGFPTISAHKQSTPEQIRLRGFLFLKECTRGYKPSNYEGLGALNVLPKTAYKNISDAPLDGRKAGVVNSIPAFYILRHRVLVQWASRLPKLATNSTEVTMLSLCQKCMPCLPLIPYDLHLEIGTTAQDRDLLR